MERGWRAGTQSGAQGCSSGAAAQQQRSAQDGPRTCGRAFRWGVPGRETQEGRLEGSASSWMCPVLNSWLRQPSGAPLVPATFAQVCGEQERVGAGVP